MGLLPAENFAACGYVAIRVEPHVEPHVSHTLTGFPVETARSPYILLVGGFNPTTGQPVAHRHPIQAISSHTLSGSPVGTARWPYILLVGGFNPTTGQLVAHPSH